jgi:importin-5
MLDDQLVLTWPKVCRAMRTDFEPYLAVVMPPLINVLATGKLGSYVVGASLITCVPDEPRATDWVSLMSRSLRKGLNHTLAHEKLRAFEALNIYCSILRERFVPYLPRCLELTLSSLRQASFVPFRDACISWVFIFPYHVYPRR